MKIIISALAVLVMLMALTPSAFASTELPSSHHPQACLSTADS